MIDKSGALGHKNPQNNMRAAILNYQPSPHVTQNWLLTKPSATGKRGMVVSQARSAAEAGVATCCAITNDGECESDSDCCDAPAVKCTAILSDAGVTIGRICM